MTAVSEALVGIADRNWTRRGGRSAGAAELAVHLSDVRDRERADLVRLETFVRESVLPRTYSHTTQRRRALEALGGEPGPPAPKMEQAAAEKNGEPPAELVQQALDICARHYAAVTGTGPEQWDTETARDTVGIALRTVRQTDRETYPQALEAYLHENRARLERLWPATGRGACSRVSSC